MFIWAWQRKEVVGWRRTRPWTGLAPRSGRWAVQILGHGAAHRIARGRQSFRCVSWRRASKGQRPLAAGGFSPYPPAPDAKKWSAVPGSHPGTALRKMLLFGGRM